MKEWYKSPELKKEFPSETLYLQHLVLEESKKYDQEREENEPIEEDLIPKEFQKYFTPRDEYENESTEFIGKEFI